MLNNTDVTIIVPVYNSCNYLEECLESLINQTYENYEILLIDDGSSDGSEYICDLYAEKNEKVRVIHQANSGINQSRRVGVQNAHGKWITFVDNDDILLPNAIGEMVKKRNGTDIVIGFPYKCKYKNDISLDQARHDIIEGKLISVPWAKLYRKKLFVEEVFDFPRDLDGEEDLIMNLRLLFQTTLSPKFVSEQIYIWRKHGDNTSLTKIPSFEHEALFDKYLLESIPKQKVNDYLHSITLSRINGIKQIAMRFPYKYAKVKSSNKYFQLIMSDINKIDCRVGIKAYFLLHVTNPFLMSIMVFFIKCKVNIFGRLYA